MCYFFFNIHKHFLWGNYINKLFLKSLRLFNKLVKINSSSN